MYSIKCSTVERFVVFVCDQLPRRAQEDTNFLRYNTKEEIHGNHYIGAAGA